MSDTTTIITIDTKFLNESSVIASYVIPSDDGLILVDTGPETAVEQLKQGLADKDLDWRDVKHVLLTHIHFDHAGAAWKFAENGATIYVHPIGLPHLHQPEKLWNSAKRIYQDDMERLWGEMQPIAQNQLRSADDGDVLSIGGVTIDVHYTPGHAIHHNAYQLGKTIFTGDVGGVKINGGPVVPPCPPPDINIEAWKTSIQKLRALQPARLYLAHYGAVTDPKTHFDHLEAILDDWANWMKPHYEQQADPETLTPQFIAYTQEQLRAQGVTSEDLAKYEKGNPSYMSVAGLLRYWKLKAQGRIK